MKENYISREIIEKYRLIAEELEASASKRKLASDDYENVKFTGLLATVMAMGAGLIIYPPLCIGTGGGVGLLMYRAAEKRRKKFEEADKEFSELGERVDKLAKEIGLKK